LCSQQSAKLPPHFNSIQGKALLKHFSKAVEVETNEYLSLFVLHLGRKYLQPDGSRLYSLHRGWVLLPMRTNTRTLNNSFSDIWYAAVVFLTFYYLSSYPSTVASQQEGSRFNSWLGPFCVELACSPRVCVGSLRVLRLPPTTQKHAC